MRLLQTTSTYISLKSGEGGGYKSALPLFSSLFLLFHSRFSHTVQTLRSYFSNSLVLVPPILDFISTITTDVLLSDLIFIKLYYGYHLAFPLSTILLHRERWLSTSARGDARVALKFPTQHLPLDHDYSLSSKIPSLSS